MIQAKVTQHKHKCPECQQILTCNNPKDCPGKGKPALCGSCPGAIAREFHYWLMIGPMDLFSDKTPCWQKGDL